MKLKSLFFIMLTLACTVGLFSACRDNDPEQEPGDEQTTPPINPETPSESDAMSPLAQKQYLEQTAIDLMNQLDSNDFNDIKNFGEYIVYTYEDYDFDELSYWAEDIFEDLIQDLGTTTKEDNGWDTYYYNNYKAIIMASNFQSHFTAKNNSWVRTDANDLQFIFKDQNNKECILKLATSGTVTKVHVGNIDDWYDYDYYYDANDYIHYIDYYNRTQLTIGVPEKITLSLTRGSETVFYATFNINLASITNENFNLSTSRLSFNSTIEFNNGYKFSFGQVAYAPTKASASFAIAKNNVSLISAVTSTDINDIPSLNISDADAYEDIDIEDSNFNLTKAYVKFDILGKVQMQGTLSDVRKYVEYIDAAEENYDNERTFKSYINQANSLADINLFYGSSVKQASVILEPFEDYAYGNESYWTAEPIIIFYDGSSYSTFEAFFNDKDFKDAIKTFENLIESFENMLE